MKAQGCGAASEIVKALKIGRASVYRVLEAKMIGASLVAPVIENDGNF
jgi:DNA invertase Pin-like site-specific DNA recombinase